MKSKTALVVVDLNKVKDPFGVLKGATPFSTAVREFINVGDDSIFEKDPLNPYDRGWVDGWKMFRNQILKKVEGK